MFLGNSANYGGSIHLSTENNLKITSTSLSSEVFFIKLCICLLLLHSSNNWGVVGNHADDGGAVMFFENNNLTIINTTLSCQYFTNHLH